MFKLAHQEIDAYSDASKSLLKKIAATNPKLNILTPEEHGRLADDDFALTIITKKAAKLNRFPVNDHDSAWLSNQYFNETHYRLPKEAQEIAAHHIKVACERFDIEPTPAVATLGEKVAASNIYVEKDLGKNDRVNRVVEVDLTKFAEVDKIADNYTFAQYAFPKAVHVKLGGKYFDEFCDIMPVDVRFKYACNLQKRAGELGVQLNGKISKYAANAYSAHLGAHLASRRSLLDIKEPKYAEALDKLAAMRDSLKAIDFAKTLAMFDKRAGIDKYYGGYLTDPFEATLGLPADPNDGIKTASGKLSAEDINSLMTTKFAKVKEYLGDNLAESLKKEGMTAMAALPADYQEILQGISDGTL